MYSQGEARNQLNFILIPFLAQGHMIPMVDLGKLIAQQGVVVTLATTNLNASRLRPTVARASESGFQIRLLELRFPCQEAGLPVGCENLDNIPPTAGMVNKFFEAMDMLQEPVEECLQGEYPFPSCIVSDMFIPWTSDTARKFKVPRLVFQSTSGFSLLCLHNLRQANARENAESDSDVIVVPGLHHHIELTKAQLPGSLVGSDSNTKFRKRVIEAESVVYGVAINSFDALEPGYIKGYRCATGKKVWAVGPGPLCNKETLDKLDRGKATSINEDLCLNWLNSRKPKSTIYACFGSMSHFSPSQLMEIGLGLEASNCSFIWVVGNRERSTNQVEKWLEEGFEERVKDRGLIIRGWAPQMLILNHPSTGGFLTHCGWNLALEAICTGVPMITWPLFAEQFINEKMIVDVLGVGVSIGSKVPTKWDRQDIDGVIKMEEVMKAVERLMDERIEGEERRKASELSAKAIMAMEESSGSSYMNLKKLIHDVMEHTCNC